MCPIDCVSVKKITSVCNKKNEQPSFKGMRLPDKVINNASDAIEMWNLLAKSKYTALENDVFSSALNKKIQDYNFSFLDKLTKKEDRITFIEYFKKVTGFPNLTDISKKIVDLFNNVTDGLEEAFEKFSMEKVNPQDNIFSNNPAHIVLRGYNVWSSAKKGNALPGSDLNGAFLVFRGTNLPNVNSYIADKYLKEFENYGDARILSFAHKGAAPKIISMQDLFANLDFLDYLTTIVAKYSNGIDFLAKRKEYALFNPNETIEKSPSIFNILLSKGLQNINERFMAKEIGEIIEGIRDGVLTKIDYTDSYVIEKRMNNSPFSWQSNILQQGATDYVCDIPQKTKIIEREKLKKFNDWNEEYQFDCIKNIIKHMTDDAYIDNRYSKMLTNEDCPIYNSTNVLNNILINKCCLKDGFTRYFGD